MIISALLYLIYGLIYGVLAITILPLADVSVNSNFANAITNASTYVANYNQIFPLATLIAAMASIILVELIVALYKLIMWILRRLPTQS